MSSLVFLGFSVIAFIISFGIGFYLVPQVLGMFYTSVPCTAIADTLWQETCVQQEGITRWLTPLVPTIGIFILVIKVFMVASVRGRD